MATDVSKTTYFQALDGNKTAVETLVRTYGDELVRFAYCFVKDSATAEDIMEDAFATLLVKRKLFSSAKNLRAYLFKTVRNRAIDYLRSRRRQQPLEDYEQTLCGEDLEENILKEERKRILYRCMQTLPTRYAEVLYLLYIEGYSAEDAAKILKKTKKQVYNLTARAKLALKERLAMLTEEGIFYEDV